jgi:hypothetical protein
VLELAVANASISKSASNDGWAVEEMWKVNEEKGVITSFDPSLTEYST